MVILDHEYIGKEINSLVDEEIEDTGELRKEELPSIPIFRKGFNPAALERAQLEKARADSIGMKEGTLRDACNIGRRLDKDVMARLQSSLNVSDDGRVSIDPTPPFAPEAKRAGEWRNSCAHCMMQSRREKTSILTGARRSALHNEWRGPATFDQIRIAVERHLTDKAAGRFFVDRIGAFWRGSATLFANRSPRELARLDLIEDAIALASGAKKSRAIRQLRNGSVGAEEAIARAWLSSYSPRLVARPALGAGRPGRPLRTEMPWPAARSSSQ